MYFFIFTTYHVQWFRNFFPTHCLRDSAGERMTAPVCAGEREGETERGRGRRVLKQGTHSYKLDRFASIKQNVTEKAILTLLEQRSTRLDIVFPSSTTPLPRAHTHTLGHGQPATLPRYARELTSSQALVCVCVNSGVSGT